MSKAASSVKPPAHLQPATKKWFANVLESYELDEHHIRLLTLAGEAWDRCQQARKAIEDLGLTFQDRFNSPRKRPEISIEIDSRIAFARIIRELDLDVDPPPEGKRPPAR